MKVINELANIKKTLEKVIETQEKMVGGLRVIIQLAEDNQKKIMEKMKTWD